MLSLIIIFVQLISCSSSNDSGIIKDLPEIKSVVINLTGNPAQSTIFIQPFDDLSEKYINYVYKEISKICPDVVLKKTIKLPKSAYYSPRNRHRADSLLTFLGKQTKAGNVTLGLTSKDISCTDGNIADWGIIGYSYCPGKASVASTFRLDKNNLSEQFFKAAIHELGHAMGLDHCPDKTCLMRDAEGKNTTNEETGFCENCKEFLLDKGWNLN